LELAKKVLKEEAPEFAQFHYDPEEIMKAVARHYQVSLADLKSDRKNRQLALPRQLAMYLCRKYSHLSLPDIGSLFGGKNHTTVLHAIRKISKTTATDAMLKDSMSKLEAGLRETSV
jgi:chromosomal replication initiator protein